ncbi:GGDEF domain-containing protein [Microbacterium paludicola]|nr:GGDEF domain-containing protein [Microbacterium paludicola]MBF0815765.1 GGDEF domain-containing protein [Microbacterium paludicola]
MSRSVDHALGPAVGRIRRALRRQSNFSATTALGAGYFAVLIAAHLVMHPHGSLETTAEIAQLVLCLLGLAWALAAGRRLPRWAGLVLIGGVAAGIAVAQFAASDLGGLLSTLFLVPLLAAYLGWGFRPRAARIMLSAIVAVTTVAALVNPSLRDPDPVVAWASVYAALVSVFTLEVSIALVRGLRRALRTDPLTGTLNRRALRAYVRAHRREGLWVIGIDMDGLKPYNDRHGHAAGDLLLRDSARSWQEVIGESGVVGRWGGDEFVVVVQAPDEQAARAVLGRLRAASPHRFSAGVAKILPNRGLDHAVKVADGDLYRDKRRAPGRVPRTYPRRIALPAPDPAEARPPRQTAYTIVCIAAAGLFVLSGLVDLLGVQAALSVGLSVADVVIGLLTVAAALAFGHRLPRWAVLAWVVLVAATTFGHISAMAGPVPLVEGILGLQLVAAMLGCFYRPGTARAFQLVVVSAVGAGLLFADPDVLGIIGPGPVIIGIPTSLFLLEVVLRVRLRLRMLAQTDELTGALNRLGFEERLQALARRSRRRGTPLAVVAVDFDDFKRLNDDHGHARGDGALRAAVALWRDGLRETDVIGRIGGDEFLIALPGADTARAAAIMQRLRAEADDSWSWGAATLRQEEQVEDLLLRADRALYAAKRRRPRARGTTRQVPLQPF